MSFMVSPGVSIKETDLTNVIPAVSTSIGAYAGQFQWGPVGEAITVSSEKELASYYGSPTAEYAQSFLTAGSFLKYGSALKVSRAIRSNATNASDLAEIGLLISVSNISELEAVSYAEIGSFIARYPGAIGSTLSVIILDSQSFEYPSVTNYANLFDYKPGSTGTGERNDEIHMLIVDDLGFFGPAGSVLEKWSGLSLKKDAKAEDGSSLYYKEVLNKNSSYVWAVKLSDYYENADETGAEVCTRLDSEAEAIVITMFRGDSEFYPTGSDGTGDANFSVDDGAFSVFADPELIDINLVFAEGSPDTVSPAESAVIELVEKRRDCVGFISAPLSVGTQTSDSNRLSTVLTKFNAATRSSYIVWDSTPLYVYNKYQDNYIWVPAAGHIAGLCAKTDSVSEPWFSPAGYNRGNLLGVTKLGYNPNQNDRDTLYKLGVNPIVSFPGQGILLFGDKTAQAKPSAFDRINVRRLFLVLEKAIATSAKFQLFELNDEFTRSTFRNMVEPFLRDVKGRRGVTDFLVVCDTTNNTPDVIDANRFVADIYIKPARSINFISLNFIATRTGVEFSEIVGLAQ